MLQSTHRSTHTHMAPVNGQCKENCECSCPRTLERHGVHQVVDIGLFHAEGTRPWLGSGLLLGEWKRSPQPTTKQNNWGVNARFSAMQVPPPNTQQLQSSLAGYVGRKRCQRRQNLHAVKPPEGPFNQQNILIYIEFSAPLLVRCLDRDACLKEAKPPNK